jgi:hypothetical protein
VPGNPGNPGDPGDERDEGDQANLGDEPAILFPASPVRPLQSLIRRIGVAALAVVVIALLTYVGRAGYRDANG